MAYFRKTLNLIAHKALLTLITLLLGIGIIYFGLRPPSWPNLNRVTLGNGDGLAFHAPGIAYVEDVSRLVQDATVDTFSICIILTPARQHLGFRPILMFHDGSDSSQLTIAQWRNEVIAMNGDDYSYRRKLPRITGVDLLTADHPHALGFTSGRKGTIIFHNGKPVNAKSELRLTMPAKSTTVRMTLGNSVYGNVSWEGILHYLAIYRHELSASEMAQTCSLQPASASGKLPPQLLFTFSEMINGRIQDLSGNGQNLLVPHRPMALKQVFFNPPWKNFHLTTNSIVDIILNLFGFMPLAAALYARLRISIAFSAWHPAISSILLCCLLSFAIELAQGWLPTRSSSILDLLLNSGGSAAGVLAIKYNWQRLAGLFTR